MEVFISPLVTEVFRVGQTAASMTSTSELELLESVYAFLKYNGHEATAKSLAREAKLDDKKLKISKPLDLMDICSSSLK